MSRVLTRCDEDKTYFTNRSYHRTLTKKGYMLNPNWSRPSRIVSGVCWPCPWWGWSSWCWIWSWPWLAGVSAAGATRPPRPWRAPSASRAPYARGAGSSRRSPCTVRRRRSHGAGGARADVPPDQLAPAKPPIPHALLPPAQPRSTHPPPTARDRQHARHLRNPLFISRERRPSCETTWS